MCGIAGAIDLRRATSREALAAAGARMAACVAHRGPDDDGTWVDPALGVVLAHRRLSIVDLSPGGHQPMVSADGRWVLSYNGEIYDHERVRRQLPDGGASLRSTSDTEVLVEAIAAWGVRRALEACNGMWAFAVLDRAERRLTFAVDRFGEKPLYVGWDRGWLLFGSELSSFRAHGELPLQIDRGSLAAYMRYGAVPAPLSIFRGVHKLPPGSLLQIDLDAEPRWVPQTWWDVRELAERSIAARPPRAQAPGAAVDELAALLADSVALRMVADVPVGAFLSGGIDSSLIVATMVAQSSDVRTFSIGFDDATYDEAPRAAAVARHLGTHHTELYVTAQDALDQVPRMAQVYSEPFADSSQVPTTLLSQLARPHVTVALTGDGGDELFAGYDRYRWQQRLAPILERVPARVRRLAGAGVTSVSPERWAGLARRAGTVVPAARRFERVGDRAHKLACVLTEASLEASYLRMMSAWDDPIAIVRGSVEPVVALTDPATWLGNGSVVERLQLADQLAYLPHDILTKVDRASMAASLETRIPLLDPRIAALAWSLPTDVHRSGGSGKHLLRSLLGRHLPTELFERPKMGFGIPVGAWMRGPLRPWAEDLLTPEALADGGLDADVVRVAWDEHLTGARDWTARMWAVLMWQSWRTTWPSVS